MAEEKMLNTFSKAVYERLLSKRNSCMKLRFVKESIIEIYRTMNTYT